MLVVGGIHRKYLFRKLCLMQNYTWKYRFDGSAMTNHQTADFNSM